MGTFKKEIDDAILALEQWRRICLEYFKGAPEYSLDLYKDMMNCAVVADQALQVAKYGVAAQGSDGNMVYGLVNALPAFCERQGALDETIALGVDIRKEVIVGDYSDVWLQIVGGLIDTVERAIDDLKEDREQCSGAWEQE